MSEKHRLLVGIDLCNDFTQITCYDERIFEPVPVGNDFGDEEYKLIPTAAAAKNGGKDWVFGEHVDALAKQEEQVQVFRDLIDTVLAKEKFMIFDKEEEASYVLGKFLRYVLMFLKKDYPNDTIRKLVVTVEERNPVLLEALYQEFGKLGLQEDRLVVQGHKQSYMYYALSQNRELWMNDVGLFAYTKKGLHYSQISIDRRNVNLIAGVKERDCSDVIDYALLSEEDTDSIKQIFLNLAGSLLHRQLVSTIYVTGEGFEHEFAKDALVELCAGRRVFKGQNLYTKGACYAARELSGGGKLEGCIFLDEEMVESNLSVRIYRDAKHEELTLVKAGTPWYDVDEKIAFIPDDEDEIQLTAQNVMKRERKSHLLSLVGIAGRDNKMTRFTLRIRFADVHTCIVTLKDEGFGTYVPSSNRIWERNIVL